MKMNDQNQFTNELQIDFNKSNSLSEKEDKSKINKIKLVNSKYDKYLPLFSYNSNGKKEEKIEYDDLSIYKNNNSIISYFYKTAMHLKNSNENKKYISMMVKSKNYIPKIQYNFLERNNNNDNNYNEKYINNYQNINNKCISELNNKNIYNNELKISYIEEYNKGLNVGLRHNLCINKVSNNINSKSNNGNYLLEGKEKNNNNGHLGLINNKFQKNLNIINCPPFIPSNSNIQQNNNTSGESNDSLSKDKESDSTSAISEKREEENNFEIFNKTKQNTEKVEKVEYLVEMFGRKGWICKLCNNFNYETRNKCNRCGIIKKPKKIVDLKQKVGNNEMKERNNKKGDWICVNCRNLNYSFRTFCNRCKIPKINNYLNDTNLFSGHNINNFQNHSIYSISPSIFIFNNVKNNPFINFENIEQ